MNTLPRLPFVFFSIISLIVFAYGFVSSGKLSDGKSLMLWSLIPASLMLFTAAFYSKEYKEGVISLIIIFLGACSTMAFLGAFKENHEVAYGLFAWFSHLLMLAGALYGMLSVHKSMRANSSQS